MLSKEEREKANKDMIECSSIKELRSRNFMFSGIDMSKVVAIAPNGHKFSQEIKEANKLLDCAEEILHYIVDSIKEKRQKAFIDACKKEGLSSREIVERASVFPFDEKSHVKKWPKL